MVEGKKIGGWERRSALAGKYISKKSYITCSDIDDHLMQEPQVVTDHGLIALYITT
jgi:hypothetical protein